MLQNQAAGGEPAPDAEDGSDLVAPAAAADAAGAAAVAGVAGVAGVRPPLRWSDEHMKWRHPCFFVFALHGPLTFWHPHVGSRTVCEFLKKVPRTGPQSGVRNVDRNDNRRHQRRESREDERSVSASRQDDIVISLRDSREAMASAAQEANQLARLQIQIQCAQHASVHSTAHLTNAHTALNIVKTLAIDGAQAKKKRKLERSLAKACLAFSCVAVPPNPFAALLSGLDGPDWLRFVRARRVLIWLLMC